MASFSAFSLALLLRLAQSGAAAESGKSVPSARISSSDRISLFSFSGWASSLRKTFLSITASQRERGQERRGRGEQSQWARLSLRWAYLLWCGKLGHLPKKLLQLMAEPAESKPKASTAPASPPALPGTHLQVPAVVTGTAQMSHEWRHLVGTKTHQLNMTQDFSNQGSLRCLWTPQHGSLLRRELPGATESTTTRLTLKAVWESQSS